MVVLVELITLLTVGILFCRLNRYGAITDDEVNARVMMSGVQIEPVYMLPVASYRTLPMGIIKASKRIVDLRLITNPTAARSPTKGTKPVVNRDVLMPSAVVVAV